MAEDARIGTALRAAPIVESGRRTMRGSVKGRSEPFSRWVLAVHLGCLLMALLAVATLSWYTSAPNRVPNAARIERGVEPEPNTSTTCAVEEVSSRRLGPAFSR